MKKVLSLLFFIFAATAFSQEISVTTQSVIGKWELHDIVNNELTAAELKENKAFLEGMFLQFNADETCIIGMIMDLDGKWSIDVAKKLITTTTRRGESTWKIHSLQKGRITFSMNDSKQKIIFRRL